MCELNPEINMMGREPPDEGRRVQVNAMHQWRLEENTVV